MIYTRGSKTFVRHTKSSCLDRPANLVRGWPLVQVGERPSGNVQGLEALKEEDGFATLPSYAQRYKIPLD